jgi:3-oxoacyl-[acyl-carrier protein] reductase
MDLGIAGKKAIICTPSRGLGNACATALASEGIAVTNNGCDGATLDEAAEEIRRNSAVEVIAIVADIDTPEGRASLLAACPDADILVNNN